MVYPLSLCEETYDELNQLIHHRINISSGEDCRENWFDLQPYDEDIWEDLYALLN
jgi:hypothetical protein